MAMPITTWEFRTTGNNLNGGGFKTGGSGTDYSQQDAAELSRTDFTTDVAGTQVTTVSGGVTAQMVDNMFNVASGPSWTPGIYHIVSFIDANNFTIDRSAGSSATAGVGKIGGARANPTDAFYELQIAGDVNWYKAGTYTLTENIDVAKDGSSSNYIQHIGYNATRGDNPTGTDRPLIACGAYTFAFDNYYRFWHLRGTGTATDVLRVDLRGSMVNCKGENTSGTAGRKSLSVASSNGGHVDICRASSTNGIAIDAGTDVHVRACYAHDSSFGIATSITGGANHVSFNIIDTCTTGIQFGSFQKDQSFVNNTVYNCTNGIELASASIYGNAITNNLFDSCTTGINATAGVVKANLNFIDHNNYSNNGTDVNDVTKGDNATAVDPGFTDAPNGDFTNTLQAAASPFPYFPGELTENYLVQGAVQPKAGGEITRGHVS
jgi:hypothetical protein